MQWTDSKRRNPAGRVVVWTQTQERRSASETQGEHLGSSLPVAQASEQAAQRPRHSNHVTQGAFARCGWLVGKVSRRLATDTTRAHHPNPPHTHYPISPSPSIAFASGAQLPHPRRDLRPPHSLPPSRSDVQRIRLKKLWPTTRLLHPQRPRTLLLRPHRRNRTPTMTKVRLRDTLPCPRPSVAVARGAP